MVPGYCSSTPNTPSVRMSGVGLPHHHVDAERLGAGAHDVDGLRVAAGVDEEGVAALGVDPPQHGHRLGRGGGLVEQRRVGEVHGGEVAHHGLEVEERLEPALRDLGLVRRVRGVPGRVLEQVALDDRRRDRARVALTDQRDEHLVAVGELAHAGQHVGFGAPDGQVERRALADRLGDGPVDQLGDRRHVEGGEHLLDLDRRRPQMTVGELPAHNAGAGYRRTNGSFVTTAGTSRPAHVDGDRVAVGGVGRQERERDPVPERGREVAAGDLADDAPPVRHRVALTRDLPAFGGEAAEPAGDAAVALGLERRLARGSRPCRSAPPSRGRPAAA